MRQAVKGAALGAVALLCFAAPSAAQDVLTYKVLKDGDPIGQEVVTITEQGNRQIVKVETQTEVNLLFLTFSYDHERTETWENGQLISVVAKTDDDGSPHAFDLKTMSGGFKGVVDGAEKTISGPAFPLSLWNESVTRYSNLFGVIDAAPYVVKTENKGDGYYVMDGDIARELWYGDDGRLKKTAFKRKGYNIEFVRN